MHKVKSPPLKIGTDIASAKTLFLRIPPELHAALVVAAGGEQQKRGERVSVNWLAAKILAKAMDLDVIE
ncbi:toxin-antitoxin system HicB family antitoxin [Collimonas pratensis]|uniref:HicB family protein n=1 Tax=Collimonas pratensis TaxID=279113 RepID=A0A127QC94_9BURK|nr:toxin-antitoxin system HicB family antitoxin [Collimonas pratensis]AMP07644.1 hicB family protein [Collimonas pratensis]